MQACIVRRGNIWLRVLWVQAASSSEVEDTTTHLRKDVIIYLSDFATVFGCVERGGRGRKYVFVWHLEQVQANTKIMSRLDSDLIEQFFVFFFHLSVGKKEHSLGLNAT